MIINARTIHAGLTVRVEDIKDLKAMSKDQLEKLNKYGFRFKAYRSNTQIINALKELGLVLK